MSVPEAWKKQSSIVEIKSPFVTLIGEILLDDTGRSLEYWRVERHHSVIILPVLQDQLILPKPSYRPGVGRLTLDFPGGRLREEETIEACAIRILDKELGIKSQQIESLTPLNNQGWEVNSSFSNQKLFAFVAALKPEIQLDLPKLGGIFPLKNQSINRLLTQLNCAQCRLVLFEYFNSLNLLLSHEIAK